ncbi:hypothetical protein [Chitinimonas sp. BJB300]|uniref:hypothetical protein n=1 Tax=Chitinimonas sp. BJB300 TaxID=1559339 RepID=UPI000C0F37E5|nr:hypothetical protein [Chitinimonas sp. BJB300]PHV11901.1 hypothetical protein CSQ89_08565 [Chitinimonas sp. BJB300]TSJ91479.1 hypothetical protein FG002_004180 [Chitinimonas sp. BJB300]
MKKMIVPLLLALLAGNSYAAGVGVRAGTMGLGGDVAWSIFPTFSARVGFSALNLNGKVSESNVEYDARMKVNNLSGLIDWHPVGPFRLTAGLVSANNKFVLNGKPTNGNYQVNGNNYNANGVVINGEVKGKNRIAPYLGVGYGNVAGMGVNFYGDLGVILQGGASAKLGVSCGSNLSTADCSRLTNDLDAERRKLEDGVKGFKAWPVVNVGLTIGF